MAQDVVTAREVAAPAAALVLLDAQRISEMLNDALEREAHPQTAYSKSAQSLFQQAWAVAAHKRSTQVTIHHLAYALVFDHPEDGKKLAEYLETDVDSFAVGCILQILPLGVSTGDANILPPAIGTVRWLGQAVALAGEQSKRRELLPEHLVRAVLNGGLPAFERGALKKAARVGNARHDAVLGPRPVPPIAVSSRDIIKHMEEVERGHATDQTAGDSDPDITDLLQEALTQIETSFDRRLTLIEQRAMRIDDVIHWLEMIDRRVRALDEALPRRPSSARLAAAIVAALTLGAAAGIALTHWQPEARVSQVVSASAK